MHILYFITSHGYGHGVRSCCIANAFPSDYKITFHTVLPECFFQEEVKRPFSYFPGEFDCGCIQSDGVTTDIEATLKKYSLIAERNRSYLPDEIKWCKENHVDLIISDITPFAFEVAHKCGIPSIAITNFTWYDIYKEYLQYKPSFAPILDNVLSQYKYADLAIALYPSLSMNYFRKLYPVSLVGRKGNNVRKDICKKFGFSENKKLGLIYVGNFGMSNAHWNRLENFSDWEFLGVYPLPESPSNFHLICKDQYAYQDLVTSADTMIAKLGYGSVSECMLNGKPIIYLPRSFFAEYPVLKESIDSWGGGYVLPEKDFYELNWTNALNHSLNAKLAPLSPDGVQQIVKIIDSVIKKG